MPSLASLRKRVADLGPELVKFGVVGLTGAVIDLGGADYLHVHLGVGPMVAKGLSITAATIVTYLGSRFWTFRHRVNQALLRETTTFVALNVVGLAIAEVVIAITTYGLDLKSELAYNGASVVGTGLGTIFRYFAYKKWVFLAGAPGAATAVVDPTSGAVLGGASYGPPWDELERPAGLGSPGSPGGSPGSLGYGPAWEHLDPAESDSWRRLSTWGPGGARAAPGRRLGLVAPWPRKTGAGQLCQQPARRLTIEATVSV
jgi:putative flippase GtrA